MSYLTSDDLKALDAVESNLASRLERFIVGTWVTGGHASRHGIQQIAVFRPSGSTASESSGDDSSDDTGSHDASIENLGSLLCIATMGNGAEKTYFFLKISNNQFGMVARNGTLRDTFVLDGLTNILKSCKEKQIFKAASAPEVHYRKSLGKTGKFKEFEEETFTITSKQKKCLDNATKALSEKTLKTIVGVWENTAHPNEVSALAIQRDCNRSVCTISRSDSVQETSIVRPKDCCSVNVLIVVGRSSELFVLRYIRKDGVIKVMNVENKFLCRLSRACVVHKRLLCLENGSLATTKVKRRRCVECSDSSE